MYDELQLQDLVRAAHLQTSSRSLDVCLTVLDRDLQLPLQVSSLRHRLVASQVSTDPRTPS